MMNNPFENGMVSSKSYPECKCCGRLISSEGYCLGCALAECDEQEECKRVAIADD